MAYESFEEPTPIVFEYRQVFGKGTPNYSVSRISGIGEEISFDQCPENQTEIDLPLLSAEKIIKAAKKLKKVLFDGGDYNCAWFAHVLAGTPIIGDIDYDAASDWDYNIEVPIDKLQPMDVGRILPKRFVSQEHVSNIAMSFGHWHTVIDRTRGLSLHVDEWQGQIQLTPTSTMMQLYPSDEYMHLHTEPQNRLLNRITEVQ